MHEQLRSDECAQLEMFPSLLQNFLAANIAGAAKHQVGDYQLLCTCMSCCQPLTHLGMHTHTHAHTHTHTHVHTR